VDSCGWGLHEGWAILNDKFLILITTHGREKAQQPFLGLSDGKLRLAFV
jgi:hypothetical protein